jgi:hypothetical protein
MLDAGRQVRVNCISSNFCLPTILTVLACWRTVEYFITLCRRDDYGSTQCGVRRSYEYRERQKAAMLRVDAYYTVIIMTII